MRVLVLSGAIQAEGDTSTIAEAYIEELGICDCDVEYIRLVDKEIHPCKGCLSCQESNSVYGCVLSDDMQVIAQKILDADCVTLVTPTYMYYCSAPMKLMLDRTLPFFRPKDRRSFESPLAGKWLGSIIVYDDYAPRSQRPFEVAVKSYANDSKMCFIGIMSEKTNHSKSGVYPIALNHARQFARKTAQ